MDTKDFGKEAIEADRKKEIKKREDAKKKQEEIKKSK